MKISTKQIKTGCDCYHTYGNSYAIDLQLACLRPPHDSTCLSSATGYTVHHAINNTGIKDAERPKNTINQNPDHNHPLIKLIEPVLTRKEGVKRFKNPAHSFSRQPPGTVHGISQENT